MPPRVRLTKEMIADAALAIVRERGIDALGARTLAEELGCSTQPIFSNFASMDELKSEVLRRAYRLYTEVTEREMGSGEYPPYKASGMAYIRFAKDEPKLFAAFFMRDRRGEPSESDTFIDGTIIPIIMKNLGIDREQAELFHLEMWMYVHGIATIFATSYLAPRWELVSDMLTDAYVAIGKYHKEKSLK